MRSEICLAGRCPCSGEAGSGYPVVRIGKRTDRLSILNRGNAFPVTQPYDWINICATETVNAHMKPMLRQLGANRRLTFPMVKGLRRRVNVRLPVWLRLTSGVGSD